MQKWRITERLLAPTPATPFVVLFPGRTGSSWLVSSLASHPRVHAEGERLVGMPPGQQPTWVESLYDRGGGRRVVARGFKTKLKDVWDTDAFASLLARREVRIIVLLRRNVVKLAVSTLNARRLHDATGRWNRTRESPPLPALEVAPAELEQAIRRVEHASDEVAAFAGGLTVPQMRLDYEDLHADAAGVIDRVLEFIDAERRPLASDVAKSTDDDLNRALGNYEELRRHFAGGPYASML